MQVSKFAAFLMLSSLSIGVFLTSSGCSQLSGFGSLSDGTATSNEMRKAAAIARAEADALDQIVAQQDAQFHQAIGATQEVASMLGAPEVVSGLIGALAGILVPSPIKRKKIPA
jgi:hypothetical protein